MGKSDVVVFVLQTCIMFLSRSQHVNRSIYRPYGPKMCGWRNRTSADLFAYMPGDLSCRQTLLFQNTREKEANDNGITDTSKEDLCSAYFEESDQDPPSLILHQACKEGNLTLVKCILTLELTYINSRGRKGRTPVMVAARYGQKEVFDFLNSVKCDLSLVDNFNDTVLHMACISGNMDIVRTLTDDEHLDIDSTGYSDATPLMTAVFSGHIQVFDYLVRRGSDMDSLDIQGNNILHTACIGGHVGMVLHILSKNRFDIDCKGPRQRTPAMLAAMYGHKEVFELLRKKGCNLKLVDEKDCTFLHLACIRDQVEMVETLIGLDIIDMNARNKYGFTAAEWAKKNRRKAAAAFFYHKK